MENVQELSVDVLANVVRSKTDQVLIVDSRTFCEFNTCHIISSVNVWSSKIRKKRLQQNALSVQDYLASACEERRSPAPGCHWSQIVVYDQSAPYLAAVPCDSFLYVLLDKLSAVNGNVYLLVGGFLEFQSKYPDYCEDATHKCTPLTSLSQPCLPVANVGPTRILPFLYLGSQHDANNRQMLQDYSVLYELNVSATCPKPDFVQDSHFLRIPVNDNFNEKLTPYFFEAFNFIDKVRESGGSVLVHCLAGISRSATVAIAYVMKHLHLPYEEAYKYVKHRRPTISPNINFVGQLLELDRFLRSEGTLCDSASAPPSFRHPGSGGDISASLSGIGVNCCASDAADHSVSYSLDYSVGSGKKNDELRRNNALREQQILAVVSSASYTTARNSSSINSRAKTGSPTKYFCSTASVEHHQNTNLSQQGSNITRTLLSPDEPISCGSTSHSATSTDTSHLSSSSGQKPYFGYGLYSRSSNISTRFGKGKSRFDENRDAVSLKSDSKSPSGGCNIPRSLSLNLKSTLEAVPGSPDSSPHSPEPLSSVSTSSLPKLNLGSLSPKTLTFSDCPHSAASIATDSDGIDFSKAHSSALKSIRSDSLVSLANQSNNSPTVIEIRSSCSPSNVIDTEISQISKLSKERNISNADINDSKHSTALNEINLSNNNNNVNYYSSTATICVSASDGNSECNNNVSLDNKPRSVCIIEVNTEAPVTYIENKTSEPMIVRETEVFATPCTQEDLNAKRLNNESYREQCLASSHVQIITDENKNKGIESLDAASISHLQQKRKPLKTLVPIRPSSSFGSILDRPKVLQLCAPIYNSKHSGDFEKIARPILGDRRWHRRITDEKENNKTQESPKLLPLPVQMSDKSDIESSSIADSSDFADTASEFSVMQSDSGISFQTDNDVKMHVSLPRCYSSSETHLNTRKKLENIACGDYSTRKSCSIDEVPKNLSLHHKPLMNINSQPLPNTCTAEGGIKYPQANVSNWQYQELVRCDSWSTSGLGSELSDWESLQEDANSNLYDDAVGPFDAVFAEVFPGDRTDSFSSPHMFRQMLPPQYKEDGSESRSDDRKPRHNSFKEPQNRWRQAPQIPLQPMPLARPASLPGVTGAYNILSKNVVEGTATQDCSVQSVELRHPSAVCSGKLNSSAPGITLMKHSSTSSRDSGYSSISSSGLTKNWTESSIGSSKGNTNGGTSVQRNDSGYYSVAADQSGGADEDCFKSSVHTSRSTSSNTRRNVTATGASVVSRKCPTSPPPRSITKASVKNRYVSPGKSVSPEKVAPVIASRCSKSHSPPKVYCRSSEKHSLANSKPGLPEKAVILQRKSGLKPSSESNPESSSPPPRTFGSSTFYLPQTVDNGTQDKKANTANDNQQSFKSFMTEKSKQTGVAVSKTKHSLQCTEESTSTKPKATCSNKITFSKKPGSSRTNITGPASKQTFSNSSNKSPTPSNDSAGSSSKSFNQSSSNSDSSRETSVESEASIILNKYVMEQRPQQKETEFGTCAIENASDNNMKESRYFSEEKKSLEKRKFKSGSDDCNKSKEKRRSCDLDLTGSDENLKKSVSLRSGIRLAQELLQSMENVVSCELSELRRCTAELSSRLKPRAGRDSFETAPDTLDSGTSNYSGPRRPRPTTSHFYVDAESVCLDDQQQSSRSEMSGSHSPSPATSEKRRLSGGAQPSQLMSGKFKTNNRHKADGFLHDVTSDTLQKATCEPSVNTRSETKHQNTSLITDRCRNEPPLISDEGLYRAQSCPRLHGKYHQHKQHHLPQQHHLHQQSEHHRQRMVHPTTGALTSGAQRYHHQRQQHYYYRQYQQHFLHKHPERKGGQDTADETQETVSELRGVYDACVLLRCNRTPPARDKLLNRYSCGSLDTQKQASTSPCVDITFESCPDLATLRGGRACNSGDSSSSSPVSSSRSSFSRLLPVS